MFTSSCDLAPGIRLSSEGIDTAPAVMPLNNDGLTSSNPADAPQLPLSPDNCQLGFNRKNSPTSEARTDKSYRDTRARFDKTRGDFNFNDIFGKSHTSQFLPQPGHEAIDATGEFSRSGGHPRNSRRDRWDGHFSYHQVLSGLSSVAKDEIKKVCNDVLRPDFAEIMAKHIPPWLLNGLSWRRFSPKLTFWRFSRIH